MIERYSRKELKAIWDDYNKYSIWLSIELAAAEAMEKLKIIPKGVVKKVKSKSGNSKPANKETYKTTKYVLFIFNL